MKSLLSYNANDVLCIM